MNRKFFHSILLRTFIVLFILSISAAFARPITKPIPQLIITEHPTTEGILLDVSQMPLSKALESIGATLHIPIHFSGLPEDLLNMSCRGTVFTEVLDCLLNRKANRVIRYKNNISENFTKDEIAEIWVAGSTPNQKNVKDAPVAIKITLPDLNLNPNAKRITKILEKAQSFNPVERAEAMAHLLTLGNTEDPLVTEALQRGLSDVDANVRSQALSSYVHHEGSEAVTKAIHEAMNDTSATVRMAAVDSISDDVELLKQASQDTNADIRNLAAIKLAALAPEEPSQ